MAARGLRLRTSGRDFGIRVVSGPERLILRAAGELIAGRNIYDPTNPLNRCGCPSLDKGVFSSRESEVAP